eukprot:15817907-Heterocapsa_arctica.AAC.1
MGWKSKEIVQITNVRQQKLGPHGDTQADKGRGKVPSISNLSGEVKVTGQKQTELYFMSAGGAAPLRLYKWAPD